MNTCDYTRFIPGTQNSPGRHTMPRRVAPNHLEIAASSRAAKHKHVQPRDIDYRAIAVFNPSNFLNFLVISKLKILTK